MPLLDKLKSAIGGATAPTATVMSFTGPEPCEECGASSADDLVGVRWLCGACAPAARREEYAERDAAAAARTSPTSGESPGA